VFEAEVQAPIARVFDAISGDPHSWSSWFPGFTKGAYEGAPGLGAKRWVRVGGTTYRETIIAFDEPSRYAWRVDSSSAPLARALVEEWTMKPRDDATLVRWTFAIDPRPLFRVASPLAAAVMRRLFARAMRNLGERLSA
jgi:uncharacterized protein YndB with AHSA1/START domain